MGQGYGFHDVFEASTGLMKRPHNFIIVDFLTFGIVGGTYLTCLWMLPMVVWISRFFLAPHRLDLLSHSLVAALSGYLFHSLFHANTNWIHLWLIWVITIASLAIAGRISRPGRRFLVLRPTLEFAGPGGDTQNFEANP